MNADKKRLFEPKNKARQQQVRNRHTKALTDGKRLLRTRGWTTEKTMDRSITGESGG